MQKLPGDLVVVLGASVFLLLITLFIVFLLMAYKKRDKSHVDEKKRLEEEFRNQLLQSQIEVQEQTFQQIGKELHDNVGQLLSTSRMLVGLAERSLANPPDALLTAGATIGQAINELRTLSKTLDKEWLERFDLIQNLQTEIDRINAGGDVAARLVYDQQLNLPPGQRIVLFRIIQEAMQNAIKHGKCRCIDIRISSKNNKLEVEIKDDGKGFDAGTQRKGMGLINMQHRSAALGGTANYLSSEGKGTSVMITIPQNQSP